MKMRHILSVCAVAAAVSSCDYLEEKYTGERRGDPVQGARRPPLLNAATVRGVETAPPPSPARADKELTPFDRYDEHGNDVTRKNYVKEWLGSTDASSPRKSFKGKQRKIEELPPAPSQEPTPSAVEPIHTPLKPAAPMPAEVVPAPTAPAPQSTTPRIQFDDTGSTPEENGVVVPLPDKHSENGTLQYFAQLQPAAGSADPHLSQVPKKPPVFKAIQEDKASAQQTLEEDHRNAMDEKKKLEEEPTELPPSTLPQVEGMLDAIKVAVRGKQPIITASR